MRIVAISDTHGLHRQVKLPKEYDVLVFAGDMLNYGDREAEFYNFSNWFNEIPCEYKVCIAGNHDGICENWGADKVRRFFGNETRDLLNESCELPNGMKLWGSPYSSRFMDWWFMYDNAKEQWAKIPEKVDILLTHGPAYKHIDIANPKYGNLGCKVLDRKILELK